MSGRVGGGLRVWGVRVDVNEELKFLGKFTRGGRSVAEGVRCGGGGVGLVGRGQGGCEM